MDLQCFLTSLYSLENDNEIVEDFCLQGENN